MDRPESKFVDRYDLKLAHLSASTVVILIVTAIVLWAVADNI